MFSAFEGDFAKHSLHLRRNEYATKLDAIAQQRSKLNAEAIAIFSSQVHIQLHP